MTGPHSILTEDLRVVNVGLSSFADPLLAIGTPVMTPAWRPAAEGDEVVGMALARLLGDPEVDAANGEALHRLLATEPRLIGIAPAREAIPMLEDRTLLHAGPPIAWSRMCGPMRGAVIGAVLLEGWARDAGTAEQLLDTGGVSLRPAHDAGAVGPMAGVVAPSMPVVIVEDARTRRRAYSTLNEGLGKVLRFGANDAAVLSRLRWMAERLGPALSAALEGLDEPPNLKNITAQALQMGDECHNRNVAATSLLTRLLAPKLAGMGPAGVETLEFLRDNNHFFLNISMAACKLMAGAAEGIPRSTVVTAMARNGVDFGLRMSGTGDEWFIAPASKVSGLYFPGYSETDANPDLGDSSITETAGLGGFAMAASPAIIGFVGGTVADAMRHSRDMRRITVGENPEYRLPSLDFVGTPTGIDVRLVLDANLAPIINTGIAHRVPGIGQIGAGVARAPMSCFKAALLRLAGV